jgi:hypothetical protein
MEVTSMTNSQQPMTNDQLPQLVIGIAIGD